MKRIILSLAFSLGCLFLLVPFVSADNNATCDNWHLGSECSDCVCAGARQAGGSRWGCYGVWFGDVTCYDQNNQPLDGFPQNNVACRNDVQYESNCSHYEHDVSPQCVSGAFTYYHTGSDETPHYTWERCISTLPYYVETFLPSSTPRPRYSPTPTPTLPGPTITPTRTPTLTPTFTPTPTQAPNAYRISGRYINIGLSPTPGAGLCGTALGSSANLNTYQVNLYDIGRRTFTESYPDQYSPGAFLFYNVPDNGLYSLDGEVPTNLRYVCAYSPSFPYNANDHSPRPTIRVTGANVPGVKYVFRQLPPLTPVPTGITPTAITPTSVTPTIPTPTLPGGLSPTPTGSAWIKVTNSSFQTRSRNFYDTVPDAPHPIDQDDPGHAYFMDSDFNDPQNIQSGVMSVGKAYIPDDKISFPHWVAPNYTDYGNQFDPTNFYDYVRSRKEYDKVGQITSITSFSQIKAPGLYYYNGPDTTLPEPLYDEVILVKEGTTLTVNSGSSTPDRFNDENDDLLPDHALALIASDIHFDPGLVKAYGIFIAKRADTGVNSTSGLKIKGNLIVTEPDGLSMRRSYPDLSLPSLFIINDPKTYLDLLPYLSVSLYDWRELQPDIGGINH